MPYEMHWEAEGVRWVYTGTMTDEDVLRSNLEAYEDPRFDSIKYQIADLRAVKEFAASSRTIRELSRMDRDQASRNPHVRVAILAADDFTRGMANMYALSGGGAPWQVEIFETEEDARAWLAG
jgi:hypothetical protein